ncbi:PREDICTED: ectonucleoside triphosphate diphosphohydrolase 8-like [Gavialis gangeticus]|uniref:ectonucleoside triphosphate diphosphohydrolase 8-like n=1 Tax=Gavialis gangeticus TaxID=94835 RepID=UPI00092E78D9|nr:PREDICTED: ectonucleoside triphosphate diphosphohydrolase 8-like [Gavialis gangeticus]
MPWHLLRMDVRCVLAVVTGLGIAALILSLVKVTDVSLPPRTKYGMVFDAGSSHTALYIYQWPADKENNTGIVSQVEACTVPGLGISSYADDPTKAGISLKVCLDKAMTVIPAKQQKETPTYLGATAGMRLLREQNSTKADQVLAEVSKAIQAYPVDFRGAQVLTGNEEGSFGWITVNYLLQTLIKFSFTGEWIHLPAADTVGALDLGGASTQIAFFPGRTIEDNSTQALFKLYGSNYSIYTHSYLCYGQNQVLKKLIASLREDNITSISHPCYPKGYQMNITTASLYDSPCIPAPSTSIQNKTLTVEGMGIPAKCRSAIQQLFNFTACSPNRTCGFNGVYQPPERGQFYAFSGYYSVFHFLNLTSGQPLSTVNSTIWDFCRKSWKELQEEFPEQNRIYLQNYCAAGFYILTILTQGYKFDNWMWQNIHFRQQVANTDMGWSLGYMLNLTNMIPAEVPSQAKGQKFVFWIITMLIVGLLLALVLWSIVALTYQRQFANYETIL